MDITETLIQIGLTLNEARIYNALLELKKGSIDEISKKANIHRRNVYDTVQRLLDKGLISQLLSEKTLIFSPVDPHKLEEIIEERSRALKEILPDLARRYEKGVINQFACIYKGVGGLKNLINLILKEEKEVYGIGSKGTWFDPRIKDFSSRAGKTWVEKEIKRHLIYDAEIKEHEEVIKTIGGEYKFLPEKYSSGSSVDIFGDYVAVYSGVNIKELDQDITIFIFKDKTLAEDYRKWFQLIWDLLPKT